jgi:hypothetical protein
VAGGFVAFPHRVSRAEQSGGAVMLTQLGQHSSEVLRRYR